MTTETRERIKAYKRMLPDLRERVIAVALLLAMSASMLGSASFAWMTLSRAPEISNVSTTIAANGNLEIALVTGNGNSAPNESMVGDSSATEGRTIAESNITWGNMINLSDPSYGLDHLVLRPATLNTAELKTNPLWGAAYSVDGRIEQMDSSFGYTSWQYDPDVGDRFAVTEDYGVRAISSMVADGSAAEVQLSNMKTAVKNKNIGAANTYKVIANNKDYMQSLATMMGLFMTARMNPDEPSLNNPDVAVSDIKNLAGMYESFLEAMEQEAEAIAALANYAQHILSQGNDYAPITAESILDPNGVTTAQLKNIKTTVTNLAQFRTDYKTISTDWQKLQSIVESGTSLKWSDSGISGIVNNLVDVGKCTVGKDNTPINSIGASNATQFLSGTQEARITNGILYRFEERTGGYLEVKNLSISATVKRMGITVPASVKANVQTTAPRDYNLFTRDFDATCNAVEEGSVLATDMVAQDTYGLAIDFWVRTNAQDSYLKLEGNVLSESEMIPAMGMDIDGNEVALYTITRTHTDEEGNSESITYDVYQGSNGWLFATDHSAVTLEDGETPKEKLVENITILGYEGVNRVWDDDLLSTDVTTQGSGSCYVYYANTPEDQARSLKLLEKFNVAFVNDAGVKLASAKMDVASHYAENGRVVVPMKLDPSDSIELGHDLQGNQEYGIMKLEQNTPTWITAIVYLDGTDLTNKDVLSAADIQGQMNIQFGTSTSMVPIENEELVSKYITVSAAVDKTAFNWDDTTSDMTSRITVSVDGTEPSTVTAFFLRAINATQGSREEEMTFTKNSEGRWVTDYTFPSPGNYVLRTVRLDGVDYELKEAPTVTVAGFAVRSLECDGARNRHIEVLSADNSTNVDVRLKFATEDVSRMPQKVQGRFVRDEDGATVNIDFTYNATTSEWKGTAKFLTSGEYTLSQLVLDGEYTELDPSFWHTASITLGMRVDIVTTSPHTFKYVPSEWADDENSNKAKLYMEVRILDNAGEEMMGLRGAKLTYTMRGSAANKMDTDLTWNGKHYEGAMANGGPGIWVFSNVMVNGDTLTNAISAPVFTIQSPEPPKYVSHSTPATQFVPNGGATMNVQISNSSTGSIEAYIRKAGSAEGAWYPATNYNNGSWIFAVPKDANGYQDGNWELTQVRLWDVFAEDGSMYTAEDPLVFDLADTNNKTKVSQRITVRFGEGQSKDLGKNDKGEVTGTFLQAHNIPSMSVTIGDFEGDVIPGITDVKLEFEYQNGTSSTYGHYSRTDLSNATEGATVTIDLTQKDGTAVYEFTETAEKQLFYAGNYKTTFSYKVGDVPYTYSDDSGTSPLPANTPKLTVSSNAPVVKFTATSPAEGTTFDVAYSKNPTGKEDVNQLANDISDDGYSVVCYYTAKNDGCDCNGYDAPKATAGLYGMGENFDSATCTVTTKGTAPDVMYTFVKSNMNANGQVFNEQILGANGENRVYLGTNAEATQLIVSVANEIYTFTLKTPLKVTLEY